MPRQRTPRENKRRGNRDASAAIAPTTTADAAEDSAGDTQSSALDALRGNQTIDGIVDLFVIMLIMKNLIIMGITKQFATLWPNLLALALKVFVSQYKINQHNDSGPEVGYEQPQQPQHQETDTTLTRVWNWVKYQGKCLWAWVGHECYIHSRQMTLPNAIFFFLLTFLMYMWRTPYDQPDETAADHGWTSYNDLLMHIITGLFLISQSSMWNAP
jgi:hypothetical protein